MKVDTFIISLTWLSENCCVPGDIPFCDINPACEK